MSEVLRQAPEEEVNHFFQQDGGRYRIRTYDFHRVKMALYR